ncbi:hypothetical protein [Chitinophaga sp. sic0106]|uniref:hypothetical protein n=1 Tax=Chitinophaga sp. sic0106 TaxID=2854785 RepID=UPI001C45CC5C|nr:hypothetical protein [Chitinophaga sp. sic0106]MBV7533042.1 hypothetical protein [Chitinophaga sp. sic0106]
MKLILYQTLEDRNNPEEVEANGPFECRRLDAWLGFGYYFWDSHIELGHWWGDRAYGTNYVICGANGKMDESCWDLHGNGLHRLEFEEISKKIVSGGIIQKQHLTVAKLIIYLKRNKSLTYSSIRALGMNSMSSASPYAKNMIFIKRYNASYLDMRPAVQVCLFDKKALSLRDYRIVYPEEYIDSAFA